MKTGIVFDMDGTLWDSTEQILKSWNRVFAEYDIVLEMDVLKSLMGKTMDAFGKRIMPDMPEEERDKIFERCFQVENQDLAKYGGVLYPEIEETLKKLSDKYPLYIVSNCQQGYIEAFLQYYGFGKYFEDYMCYGDNGKGKEINERVLAEKNHLDRLIYVGDIQGDYDATMEAGYEFIHAAYGFGSVDADVPRIDKFSDLVDLLEQLV